MELKKLKQTLQVLQFVSLGFGKEEKILLIFIVAAIIEVSCLEKFISLNLVDSISLQMIFFF